MTRYSGIIGFQDEQRETSPGIWQSVYHDHHMTGVDLGKDYRRQNGSTVNDTITVANRISVVADAYTFENVSNIKYASYMGRLWKVSEVQIERPRLILSLGDLYEHGSEDVVDEI